MCEMNLIVKKKTCELVAMVSVKVFNYARLLDWTKRLRAYSL